jgi:hypothetical protein
VLAQVLVTDLQDVEREEARFGAALAARMSASKQCVDRDRSRRSMRGPPAISAKPRGRFGCRSRTKAAMGIGSGRWGGKPTVGGGLSLDLYDPPLRKGKLKRDATTA